MKEKTVAEKLETLCGQIEALRVFVIATALVTPDRIRLRLLTQELLQSQRDLLLAQSVSDEFLAGLDSAGELMQALILQDVI